MTLHYHCTPITPRSTLYELRGFNFCVSFTDPRDAKICHQIGQSVMLDNGAFGHWRRNAIQNTRRDWSAFYRWAETWLAHKTTWAVIPDTITGTEFDNAELIAEWFAKIGSYRQAAPVWHLHESFEYLDRLTRNFERVCFGSSGIYSQPNSPRWNERMNEVFNRLCKGSGRPPCWIHMLRGMSLAGSIYPFASLDSSDIAMSHGFWRSQGGVRALNSVAAVARAWDARQCPSNWRQQPIQQPLDWIGAVSHGS